MNRGGARRGHLSTKVPGARNRPAPPKADAPDNDAFSERRAVLAASESEPEPEPESEPEPETGPPAAAAGPLAGLMIAFTGIPAADKAELVSHAEALGAETQPDLTIAATHLVSLQVRSTKYRQAVLHGMTVVHPEWLRTVRLKWVEDTPCDAIELAEDFPLAPMQGLRTVLAAKGSEEQPRVQEAMRKLHALGASCSLLTEAPLRPKTSHIIFLDTEPAFVRAVQTGLRDSESQGRTSQMSAESHRRSLAEVKFVRWEWVEDCARVKLCIAEDLYDPLHPPSVKERENHAQSYRSCRAKAKDRLLKERARYGLGPDALLITSRANARKTPNRPRLVDSIVQTTTAPVEHTRPASKWEDDSSARKYEKHPAMFKRESSLRKESGSGVDSCGSSLGTSSMVLAPVSASEPAGSRFFDGVGVRVIPQVENHEQVIQHCARHGAHVISAGDRADFTIVPLAYPHPAGALDGTLVTSLWLEESLSVGRKVPVNEQFFFVPTKVSFPLEGSADVVLHSTGLPLTGPVRHNIGTIAKRMGLTVAPALSRICTHLLVGPENPAEAKVEMAKRIGAHAVDLTFLQRMYKEGTINPLPTPRLAPKRLSQFTASQAPTPTALPSTYVPGRSVPPLPPPGPVPPSLGRPSHPDPIVSQLRHVLLSDGKNRLVGGGRRPRAPAPPKRASTSPRPPAVFKSTSMPVSVPLPEPDPSPEQCPAQTQVIMSYDDPGGRRERERLDALISGEPHSKARASSEHASSEIQLPPSAASRSGRRARTLETDVVDVTSSLPKRPRRH